MKTEKKTTLKETLVIVKCEITLAKRNKNKAAVPNKIIIEMVGTLDEFGE